MGTVADKLTYLQETKEAIRKAIEAQGGTVAAGLHFVNMRDISRASPRRMLWRYRTVTYRLPVSWATQYG